VLLYYLCGDSLRYLGVSCFIVPASPSDADEQRAYLKIRPSDRPMTPLPSTRASSLARQGSGRESSVNIEDPTKRATAYRDLFHSIGQLRDMAVGGATALPYRFLCFAGPISSLPRYPPSNLKPRVIKSIRKG